MNKKEYIVYDLYDQRKVMNEKQYIAHLYGQPKFRRWRLMDYLRFQDRGYPTPFGPICFGTSEI